MRITEVIQGSGLFEMPQNIEQSDFGFDQDAVNKSQANKLLSNRKCKQVGMIKGVPLFKIGNKYALIENEGGNNTEPRIRYYVQYENNWISLIKRNAIQQVLVWRAGGFDGIAATIFYDYLIKETGCIVTDSQQSPQGKRFWFDRINNAFSRGLYVYYIDIMSPNRVIKRLTDMIEVGKISAIAWGDSQKNQERRIIICTEEIPEVGDLKLDK